MINSTANKQVRRVVNLCTQSKARREEGGYVAEGLRMCRECSPDEVQNLYVTEAFAAEPKNRSWLKGFPHELVTDAVMGVMAGTKTPQGVLAVVRQKSYRLEDMLGAPENAGRLPEGRPESGGHLGAYRPGGTDRDRQPQPPAAASSSGGLALICLLYTSRCV